MYNGSIISLLNISKGGTPKKKSPEIAQGCCKNKNGVASFSFPLYYTPHIEALRTTYSNKYPTRRNNIKKNNEILVLPNKMRGRMYDGCVDDVG